MFQGFNIVYLEVLIHVLRYKKKIITFGSNNIHMLYSAATFDTLSSFHHHSHITVSNYQRSKCIFLSRPNMVYKYSNNLLSERMQFSSQAIFWKLFFQNGCFSCLIWWYSQKKQIILILNIMVKKLQNAKFFQKSCFWIENKKNLRS